MVAGAAVYGNDERDVVALSTVDKAVAHAVAIYETIWEHDTDISRTSEMERVFHECAGSDAVYVVIAINENFFVTRHGSTDAFHGGGHVRHSKRISEVFVFRMEKIVV